MIVSLGTLSKHNVKETEFSGMRAHVHLSLYSCKNAIENTRKANPNIMEWKCIDITVLKSLCTAQSTDCAQLHTGYVFCGTLFFLCLSVYLSVCLSLYVGVA